MKNRMIGSHEFNKYVVFYENPMEECISFNYLITIRYGCTSIEGTCTGTRRKFSNFLN